MNRLKGIVLILFIAVSLNAVRFFSFGRKKV